MSGQTGQTLGGGIIGFSPASPRQSILTYKKKNHYNEWEFTYSPLQDMMQQAGGNTGMIGTPVVACFSPDRFALQSRRWSPWAAPHRIVSMQQQWPLVAQDALEDLLSEGSRFSYTG